MRRALLILLILFASVLTACSYVTDFVVVNGSDKPTDVRYRVRSFPGPFYPPVAPATKSPSQLADKNKPWRELPPARYFIDPEARTVTVRVMPNEALLITRVHRAGMQVDEADEAESFSIDEIAIAGAYGEIRLEGKQARKSFIPESKEVFALMYK